MKKTTPRRMFLKNTALATTGLALFSTEMAKAFTDECPFPGYNPFTEESTDLRTVLFGKYIEVSGTIYDKSGTVPQPDTLVEVWHLSPGSDKFRHRAKLKTGADGTYSFITDFPNSKPGRNAKVYFKISNGNSVSFTKLLLTSGGSFISSEHWEKNKALGDKLLPKQKMQNESRKITFNLIN